MYVYLLQSSGGNTYVGATVDLDRRLRQHNKEITGGARATGSKVARGEIWRRIAHVSGFPTWQATLQFEWRWKQLTRQLSRNMKPLERRIIALEELLNLEKSTHNAIPFLEWPSPPCVHIEAPIDNNIGINYEVHWETKEQGETKEQETNAETV